MKHNFFSSLSIPGLLILVHQNKSLSLLGPDGVVLTLLNQNIVVFRGSDIIIFLRNLKIHLLRSPM